MESVLKLERKRFQLNPISGDVIDAEKYLERQGTVLGLAGTIIRDEKNS